MALMALSLALVLHEQAHEDGGKWNTRHETFRCKFFQLRWCACYISGGYTNTHAHTHTHRDTHERTTAACDVDASFLSYYLFFLYFFFSAAFRP